MRKETSLQGIDCLYKNCLFHCKMIVLVSFRTPCEFVGPKIRYPFQGYDVPVLSVRLCVLTASDPRVLCSPGRSPTNSPSLSCSQPSVSPGECFAFRGQGYFVLALSRPIEPTEFVLEHIPRNLTPTAAIDSAPRNFTVLVREIVEQTDTRSFQIDTNSLFGRRFCARRLLIAYTA